MLKKLFLALLSGVAALSFNSAFAAEEKPMTFVVIGDVHYFARHGTTETVIRAMRDDMKKKNIHPHFIGQVGDVIENQNGPSPISGEEGAKQWKHALSDIKKVFPDTPFLIAPGNHDWYGNNTWFGGRENLFKLLIPFLQKELKSSLNGELFYRFRAGDNLFIFLNHNGMEKGMDIEQRDFLQKAFAAADENDAIRHVWTFGHCGLWNVNYCRFNENLELTELCARSVKHRGYFTGHIHQNNMTMRHAPGENPVFQIVAAGLKGNFPGVPLQERTLILNPAPTVRKYAAIPESCASYCVIETKGDNISLRYEKIGGGTIAAVTYDSTMKIKEHKLIKPAIDHTLPKDPATVKLHIYSYFPERFLPRTNAPEIIFNGKRIGKIRVNSGSWHSYHFIDGVEIPADLVKKENTIVLTNPMKEAFVMRDMQLEVVSKDGKTSFSKLYPKVIIAGNPDNIHMNYGLIHPEFGIMFSSLKDNVPVELREIFPVNVPLTFKLHFE